MGDSARRVGEPAVAVGIAFFDLDKTLLAVNSGTLWVRRELALGHLTKRQFVGAMVWLTRYHLGLVSGDDMMKKAVAAVAGTRADDIRSRTERFFREEVVAAFRPGALEALAQHRQRGDRCVLLTSSSNYMSTLVLEHLALDSALCNTLEVDATGLHTGHVVGTVCFGIGKRVFAEAEAARAGVSLSTCAFYTDSFSDVSVLEVVGAPVAVNPDPRLKRHASKRRWPVVDWGQPSVHR
ncbi:MAG: HAD-IB family hydrolase [Archangium sp.]|nr:HAD-IB family hydrolase [Archangium sp.]